MTLHPFRSYYYLNFHFKTDHPFVRYLLQNLEHPPFHLPSVFGASVVPIHSLLPFCGRGVLSVPLSPSGSGVGRRSMAFLWEWNDRIGWCRRIYNGKQLLLGRVKFISRTGTNALIARACVYLCMYVSLRLTVNKVDNVSKKKSCSRQM
jgi:hypothetical protein